MATGNVKPAVLKFNAADVKFGQPQKDGQTKKFDLSVPYGIKPPDVLTNGISVVAAKPKSDILTKGALPKPSFAVPAFKKVNLLRPTFTKDGEPVAVTISNKLGAPLEPKPMVARPSLRLKTAQLGNLIPAGPILGTRLSTAPGPRVVAQTADHDVVEAEKPEEEEEYQPDAVEEDDAIVPESEEPLKVLEEPQDTAPPPAAEAEEEQEEPAEEEVEVQAEAAPAAEEEKTPQYQ